jgi:RimJ/RimL family protein N-acetyltransferase
MVTIRQINTKDAEEYIKLNKTLDSETIFRLYEPDENHIQVEEQRENISRILKTNVSTILVAEENGKLIGYLSAIGREAGRVRHCVHIAIGILQTHCGKGIGTRLFEELEKWARKNNIHRLELTVMDNNPRGQALYKKMGFEVEGIKRHSLLVDGQFINDIYMSKLL